MKLFLMILSAFGASYLLGRFVPQAGSVAFSAGGMSFTYALLGCVVVAGVAYKAVK